MACQVEADWTTGQIAYWESAACWGGSIPRKLEFHEQKGRRVFRWCTSYAAGTWDACRTMRAQHEEFEWYARTLAALGWPSKSLGCSNVTHERREELEGRESQRNARLHAGRTACFHHGPRTGGSSQWPCCRSLAMGCREVPMGCPSCRIQRGEVSATREFDTSACWSVVFRLRSSDLWRPNSRGVEWLPCETCGLEFCR
mmetsp:Transcript_138186/g.243825  ORF Transcript_138186/g.243825 Transcript_138186/m.243825 type:complete len:200 (-) Transcript_138186:381-980(-)